MVEHLYPKHDARLGRTEVAKSREAVRRPGADRVDVCGDRRVEAVGTEAPIGGKPDRMELPQRGSHLPMGIPDVGGAEQRSHERPADGW